MEVWQAVEQLLRQRLTQLPEYRIERSGEPRQFRLRHHGRFCAAIYCADQYLIINLAHIPRPHTINYGEPQLPELVLQRLQHWCQTYYDPDQLAPRRP